MPLTSLPLPEVTAAALVAALVRDGAKGPVLVVAAEAVVGGLAPSWAEAFARVGWRHRVRVVASPVDRAELADVAAEMSTFAPGLIVAAGPPEVTDAVLGMAGAVSRPVLIWPATGHAGGGIATPTD